MDVEEAEEIVKSMAKRRSGEAEVKEVIFKSHDMVTRGGHNQYTNFAFKGKIKYKEESGFLSGGETGEKRFKAEVDAKDGRVVRFKEFEP